jgi:hypothetical protein
VRKTGIRSREIPVARRSLKASVSRPLRLGLHIEASAVRKTEIRWRGSRSREDP